MKANETGFELPIASTDLTKPVEVHDSGAQVTFTFTFNAAIGSLETVRLRFEKVRAYRYRGETHCTSEQIEASYDRLVEIADSPWAAEIRRDTTREWRDFWIMRHFMIFADSNGCYEVLAESWSSPQ